MVEETKKEETPTPEELKEEIQEEEEVIKFSKAEEQEVRSGIIKKYELDEDSDTELIDNLTKDSLADRKRFGKLVGQKRKKREELNKLQKKPEKEKDKPKEEEDKKEDKPKFLTAEDLDERDRKKDLEALDISDELKKQVESYAKLHKVSIKKAFESKYISFLKKEKDEKQEEEDASAGGSRKTRTEKGGSKKEVGEFKHDDFDLSTKEGREEYAKWKKEQKME